MCIFFHVELISPFLSLKRRDNAKMCYQNIAQFVYLDQPNIYSTNGVSFGIELSIYHNH